MCVHCIISVGYSIPFWQLSTTAPMLCTWCTYRLYDIMLSYCTFSVTLSGFRALQSINSLNECSWPSFICHGQQGQRPLLAFPLADIKVFWSSHAALTTGRALNKGAVSLCLTDLILKLLSWYEISFLDRLSSYQLKRRFGAIWGKTNSSHIKWVIK